METTAVEKRTTRNADLYAHIPTDEIIKRYEELGSHRKVAKLLGMGPCSVGNRLRKAGIVGTHECVTAAQLKECQLDVAWEARNGIADRVVCRVPNCGRLMAEINANGEHSHLLTHDKTGKDYASEHPGARFCSFARSAAQAKRRGRSTTIEQLMKHFADSYLTPKELRQHREDPYFEKRYMRNYAACRLCGFKSKSDLYNHLKTQHGLKPVPYHALWPNAPTVALGLRPYRRKQARLRGKRMRALAWRPSDWNAQRRKKYRIVGTLLFMDRELSNKQLADALDDLGILKCPHGPTWRTAATAAPEKGGRAFTVFINRVRDWVHVYGKEGGPTRLSIHK